MTTRVLIADPEATVSVVQMGKLRPGTGHWLVSAEPRLLGGGSRCMPALPPLWSRGATAVDDDKPQPRPVSYAKRQKCVTPHLPHGLRQLRGTGGQEVRHPAGGTNGRHPPMGAPSSRSPRPEGGAVPAFLPWAPAVGAAPGYRGG